METNEKKDQGGWKQPVISGSIVAAVFYILMNLGLVGPDAVKSAVNTEQRYFTINETINKHYAEINTQLIEIRNELTILKGSNRNNVTTDQFEIWINRMAKENPELHVPDLR